MMRLEEAALRGALLINDVIYAETSVRFRRIEDFDAALGKAGLSIAPIPRPALFLAGKAFAQYRSSGGVHTGVLPDFFIGAHAMAVSVPLLTRDARRYRTYFPADLIAPESY